MQGTHTIRVCAAPVVAVLAGVLMISVVSAFRERIGTTGLRV